jgi:tetratricopeptide (TPR) repeat protein
MPGGEPYTVVIVLAPGTNTTRGTYDFTLRDRGRQEIAAVSIVGLDLTGEVLVDRRGGAVAAPDFCGDFLRGEPQSAEFGLALGRLLAARLFENRGVAELWEQVRQIRGARPLRVELVLPSPSDALLAAVPFEMLADEHGFVFRRPGSSLVRTLHGLRSERLSLPAGTRALCAWANPLVDLRGGTREPLPVEDFTAHERALAELGPALGWDVREPCAVATRETLAQRLVEEQPAVVSLIAHGPPGGGAVLLHNAADPDAPRDLGDPVEARSLAHDFRAGGVRLAFLWSCHGGVRHPVSGAVAEALLREDEGGLAAVLASHAALRSDGTGPFARALLEAWKEAPDGDLEWAVSRARDRMKEEDLQWAAPLYFARPEAHETVSREERVRAWAKSPGPRPTPGKVEGAPRQAAHFRGREGDRRRLADRLAVERVVSVLGMPGIGKTELLVAAANDAAPGFERALWLSLEGYREVESLRADLAVRFGRKPEDCKEDRDLAAAIGPVQALLVLDNAEDMLRGAASTVRFQALLGTILCACPGVRVLLSSRRKLGDLAAAPEEQVRLDRLPAPYDAEAFVAAAGPRLAAEDRGSTALRELVRMLDGHPQSLVLVAGQVGQGTSLATLKARVEREGAAAIVADELRDEEDLGEVPDTALRRKRLISSLNLSFRPLEKSNPGAAEMFAWLGSFPGGVPEVLVPAIFGEEGPERAAVLERLFLVEKRGEDRRVGLPAPVRWYAKEQEGRVIGEERRRELLVRSWEAMAGWLESIAVVVGKVGAQAAWTRAVPESETLECLVRADAALPEDAAQKLALAMGTAVTHFADVVTYGGLFQLAIPVAQLAASAVIAAKNPHCLGHIKIALGALYMRGYRLQEAEIACNEALVTLAEVHNDLGRARAYLVLGDLHGRADRLIPAYDAYWSALQIYGTVGDRMGQANARHMLGEVNTRRGRDRQAEADYRGALTEYEALGAHQGEANVCRALADLLMRADQIEEAEAYLTRALNAHVAIEDKLGEANARRGLGDLYAHTSRVAQAEEAYECALQIYVAFGSRTGEANARKMLGAVYELTGREEEAEIEYVKSHRISRSTGDRLSEAHALHARGELAARSGRPTDARALHNAALQLYQLVDDLLGQANSLQSLARLAHADKDFVGATLRCLEALEIARRISSSFAIATTTVLLAHVACAAGYPARAVVLTGHAFARLHRPQSNRVVLLLVLGDALRLLNDRTQACKALVIAWVTASSIAESQAAHLTAAVSEECPDFDPTAPPSPDLLAAHEADLLAVIAKYERQLAAESIDPYSPLPPP